MSTPADPTKPTPAPNRKDLRGSGIGKIRMTEDAFSPETDLQIQKLFEADNPNFDPA